MDPNQTWKDLCAAYNRRDWPQVKELAASLIDWLAKGGFPPKVETPFKNEELLALIVEASCKRFLRDANRATVDEAGQ